MAFTSTIDNNGVPEFAGRLKVTRGTFSNNSGSTGGDIDTGLKFVHHMTLQHTGSAVVASAPVINETLPGADGSAVTIVTVADTSGSWEAHGE